MIAGVDSADGAAAAGDVPRSRSRVHLGIPLVVLGFLALLGTELALVLTIPGINYAGADGKAAQAGGIVGCLDEGSTMRRRVGRLVACAPIRLTSTELG